MADELKKLLENNVLSNEVKTSIIEAWNDKIQEVKEEVAAEIRNEFANKFNKEKSEIVEAMNAMIQDIIVPVLEDLDSEKKAAISQQVKLKRAIRENAKSFNILCKKVLIDEVKEFRQDRKAVAEGFGKMDNFIKSQVSVVLEDLHEKKRALVEQKVQLKVKSAKELKETKLKLVNSQAKLASKFLQKVINEEMSQLKTELQKAREDNFGRRIFEAYCREYKTTFFNEASEVKKLRAQIKHRDEKLSIAEKRIQARDKMISESKSKIRKVQENLERTKVLNDLLRPLSGEKRAIMNEMLEKHPLNKLQESFEKYLPIVLEDTNSVKSNVYTHRHTLTEMTGDRKNIISDQISEKEKAIISEFVKSSKKLGTKLAGI